MKTSNKILWFGLGTLFGGVVAFVLFLRISTSPIIEGSPQPPEMKGSNKPISQTYPLKYFSKINASGKWVLNLQRGETYTVAIEAPEYIIEGLRVEKQGDGLELSLKRGWRLKKGSLKASITLPSLSDLDLGGAVSVNMTGFDSQHMAIKASGSTQLGGSANKIYYLTLKGSGSTHIDLKSNPVTFLEIDLSGSSNVAVSMAGGDLKGKISGSGQVVYDGDIRDQEVSISGSGSIKRINPAQQT